ncbi:MAG: glycosyltransferase family 2 protein [Patescibacteria group bacterium]
MKIAIGFITYNNLTAKYLPFFVPSLKESLAVAFNEKEYCLLAVDNSDLEENDNKKYLKDNLPDIVLTFAGSNLGFAKAYNLMIERALKLGAEYFLMLNPDMVLAPDSIVKLVKALDDEASLGAVAPRILRWDFDHNILTSTIDSDGLVITSSHRFFDRHQGSPVINSESEMIFGFTGAAALIRMKALANVAYGREYLDELMFMYKEDIDLSYRLQLAGWSIKLIPEAHIYHDRTVSQLGRGLLSVVLNRKNKSRQVRSWSFLNQWILVLKYSHLPYSFRVKWQTWFYQLMSSLFVLLFEFYLIKELFAVYKIRGEIRAKRQSLKIVINPNKIEKMMN